MHMPRPELLSAGAASTPPRSHAGTGRERDLRVDFARGLVLWSIFVSHTPENILRYVAPKQFFFAEAPEIFVLLAGYAAGLLYSRELDRHGWLHAGMLAVRRSGVIYFAHILTFVFCVALVGYLVDARVWSTESFAWYGLAPLLTEPFKSFQQFVVLRYQPRHFGILPLYTVVLAWLAMMLPLIRRPRILLGLSIAVYLAVQLVDDAPRTWPAGTWAFNPLAWQLIFCIGVVLGSRLTGPSRPPPVPLNWWLLGTCVVLLLIGKPLRFLFNQPDLLIDAPQQLVSFVGSIGPYLPGGHADETSLHPIRLLQALALAYTVRFIILRDAAWLRGKIAWPFVLLGQNGLPVFCATTVGAVMASALLEYDGWPMQVAVNAAGLAGLVAVAACAARLKRPR